MFDSWLLNRIHFTISICCCFLLVFVGEDVQASLVFKKRRGVCLWVLRGSQNLFGGSTFSFLV